MTDAGAGSVIGIPGIGPGTVLEVDLVPVTPGDEPLDVRDLVEDQRAVTVVDVAGEEVAEVIAVAVGIDHREHAGEEMPVFFEGRIGGTLVDIEGTVEDVVMIGVAVVSAIRSEQRDVFLAERVEEPVAVLVGPADHVGGAANAVKQVDVTAGIGAD